MLRFAAIGECMIEMRQKQGNLYAMDFAGDSFNVAWYLSRYRQAVGVEVYYVTALGADPYSDKMLSEWQQAGIKTDFVTRLTDKLPGLYLIHNDQSGERFFYYYRSESAARELLHSPEFQSQIEKLYAFDYLYLSGISLAILDAASQADLINLLKMAKSQGCKICFDSNYRSRLWKNKEDASRVMQKVLAEVDMALLTFTDEQALFGDENPQATLARLHQFTMDEVVVKLGEHGCLVKKNQMQKMVPSQKIQKALDTTAAGDAFNAAYLAARMKGESPEIAAEKANRLAAEVVMHPGAIMPIQAVPVLF